MTTLQLPFPSPSPSFANSSDSSFANTAYDAAITPPPSPGNATSTTHNASTNSTPQSIISGFSLPKSAAQQDTTAPHARAPGTPTASNFSSFSSLPTSVSSPSLTSPPACIAPLHSIKSSASLAAAPKRVHAAKHPSQGGLHLALQVSAISTDPPAWWRSQQILGFSWKHSVPQAVQECVCMECGNSGRPSIFKAKLQGAWDSPPPPARTMAGGRAVQQTLDSRAASGA